jgi:outer membrane protein
MKASITMAADLSSTKDVVSPPVPVEDTHWFVRLGAAGLFYNASANLTLGGAPVPGGSAKAPNNFTAMFEFGYFMTPNLSVQLTGGYPPTATINGAGTVATLGTLGKVTYGPAALTFNYNYKGLGPFQPYLGVGIAYAIIFANHDGAVRNLNVDGEAGFVIQGGADYFINRNWSVFVDAKHIFLRANATGNVMGLPGTAALTVDPTIVSGGVSYHW